MLSVMLG